MCDFTAKPLDKETGLYNFPQRYYDSRNVKWLTLDPIGPMLMVTRAGSVEALNWYNYCSNNPIMYHDPEGEEGTPSNILDDSAKKNASSAGKKRKLNGYELSVITKYLGTGIVGVDGMKFDFTNVKI